MDTLTHIVLGGCIGELLIGKQLGKKALFLGAFAQSTPDLDFVASFWLPVTADLLAHRGFTHSFLFVLLLSPLLALLSVKLIFKQANLSLSRWVLFWGLQMFTHIFIDAFNAYGTGWFEPFSHVRISFNTMFVADPLFTVWVLTSFLALLIMSRHMKSRMAVAGAAVTMSSLYLLVGIANKLYIDNEVGKSLTAQKLADLRFMSAPTPLNNLLWYIVIQNDSGFYIGYRSVFDKEQKSEFHYLKRNNSLLKGLENTTDVLRLKRFSQGYYTVGYRHDSLVFNDLRFGEIAGWCEPAPSPVFYYFLQYPAANDLIVQRGRFAKWDKQALMVFMNRIKGI